MTRDMKLSPIPLSLLALVALGACADSSTQWVKAGADAEDFRRDRASCVDRADDYAFVDDRRGRARLGSTGADLYRDCMESRGWRRERAKP